MQNPNPNNPVTYFHADDYGITQAQTDLILDCYENGVLNSVSVMPNTDYLPDALKRLEGTGIRKVCHLNFIEGKSLSDPSKCPLLVDKDGHFCCSFGYLLKCNFGSPSRRRHLKQQLEREILAQIKAVFCDDTCISVDSHQHFLMIPVVLEAFLSVIADNHYTLSEIRIPTDPLKPLLTTPRVWKYLRPVDVIKWCVLRFLSLGSRKKLEAYGATIPVFFGIFFTCHMEHSIVSALLLKYQKIAAKKNTSLELMFHPGAISSTNELLDPNQQDLVLFYASDDRRKEAMALKALSKRD